MSVQLCGDRLAGVYAEVTFVCTLPAGHHGRHQDDQLGLTVEWTPNSLRMQENAA